MRVAVPVRVGVLGVPVWVREAVRVWLGVRVMVGVVLDVDVRVTGRVRDGVEVTVAVPVRLGVSVRLGVRVIVPVWVTVPVRVRVGVGPVAVGVDDAVLVRVADAVLLGARVTVTVGVLTGLAVRVRVANGVKVASGVTEPLAVTVPLGVTVGVPEAPGVAEMLAVGEAVDGVRVGVGLGEATRHPDRALLTAAINSSSLTAWSPSTSKAGQTEISACSSAIETPRMSSFTVTTPLPSQSPTQGRSATPLPSTAAARCGARRTSAASRHVAAPYRRVGRTIVAIT